MNVRVLYTEDKALARSLGYEHREDADVLFVGEWRGDGILALMQRYADVGVPLIAHHDGFDTRTDEGLAEFREYVRHVQIWEERRRRRTRLSKRNRGNPAWNRTPRTIEVLINESVKAGMPMAQAAREYGVDVKTVYRIIHGGPRAADQAT